MSDLTALFAQAKAAFDALTPDQQIHHRNQQRISFATGNVGLSRPDRDPGAVRADAERAAGPCPCAQCQISKDGPFR